MGLTGVELEKVKLDSMLRPLTLTADTVEAVMANKPANFSWQELLAGSDGGEANSKRKFIDIQPQLDFTALQPGQAATDAIRKAVSDLKLPQDFSARVRLTGPIPIADEEFATVQEGMLVNGIGTVVIVLGILYLALKSGRIILAVFLNLVVGPCDDGRAWVSGRRAAQPDLDRVCRAVRRPRRRFRNSVQRALSRRSFRRRRSALGARRMQRDTQARR